MMRLQVSHQQPNDPYLMRRLEEATYGSQLAIGFGGGLFKGIRARYAVMRGDFQRDYALIQKLFSVEFAVVAGDALTVSFNEFLVRPIFEKIPEGLTPEASAAAQRLIEMFDAMALLNIIGLIDDLVKANQLFDQLGVGVEELLEILAMEGQAWASSVVLEPDAGRQGAMLGESLGVALFEIVRIIVEPPALDAAHLVSSLALTSAEQQALGI